MKYLRAEHLKFKRTVFNKLLFITPFITALFAWIIGGFYGFQYMTFYWWYSFLLPGTIAILCSLSHQKEEKAGKYYSILSLPISLKKFEIAKVIILTEKLFIASIFLSLFILISNLISPSLAVYSVSSNFKGSIAMIIASVWQIPFCLLIARNIGIIFPVIINTLFGIMFPIILENTMLAWICPYCWTAKFGELFMGISSNGTFTGDITSSKIVLLPMLLSVFLYFIFLMLDVKDFSKVEDR